MVVNKTIRAKNVKPDRLYYTQKGILVQPAITPVGNLSKDLRDGNILFWRVKDGKADTSKRYPIPYMYRLRNLEGSNKAHPGAGRPPHKLRTWQGWAHDNPEFPDAVIDFFKKNQCYVIPSANYFRIGRYGRNLAAVFRRGVLGLGQKPEGDFVRLPFERVKDKFMSWRLALVDVEKEGLGPQLMQALREHVFIPR